MYRESEFGFAAKDLKKKRDLDAEYENSKEIAMRELKKVMKPELINRLDAILVFHPLTQENVEKIFDNLIEELKKRLVEKGLSLQISPEVKQKLIEEGYDPKNGARPLRRVIEDKVETLIAEAMITGELKKGNIAKIGLSREKTKTGERKLTLKVANG